MTQPSGRQLSETEARAVKILQAALRGVHIVPVDLGGGPQQLHDFNLDRDDGTVEALEVTEATIEELRAANAAREKKLPGATLAAPSLDRNWHIYPPQQTRMGELHKAIPLLAQIEAKIRVDGLDSWGQHPAAQRLYTDFHIEYARPWGETDNPKLIVGRAPDLSEWIQDPSDPGSWVQQAVQNEANKADNRRKLAASGATERHLFVWVDLDYYLPWKDLDFGHLPTSPPILPNEVTSVWVAASGAGGRCVVWRVRPPGPWQAVPISGSCDEPSISRPLVGRVLRMLYEFGRSLLNGILARYFNRRRSG